MAHIHISIDTPYRQSKLSRPKFQSGVKLSLILKLKWSLEALFNFLLHENHSLIWGDSLLSPLPGTILGLCGEVHDISGTGRAEAPGIILVLRVVVDPTQELPLSRGLTAGM